MRTAVTATGAVAMLLGAVAAVLTVVAPPPDFRTLAPAAALAFGGTGLLVARRGRPSPAALVLAVVGASFGLSAVARCYGILAIAGDYPGAQVAVWVGAWLFAPSLVAVAAVLPLVLPDGHLPSPRWLPALGLALVAVIGQALVWATTPYHRQPFPASRVVANPVGIDATAEPVVVVPLGLLAVTAVLVALSSLVVRWRRAGDVERQQLKWLALGLVAATAIWALAQLSDPRFELLTIAFAVPVPLCCAVAALRHRLWDVDLVISRALVAGAVSLLVLAVAAGLVGLLGGLFGLGDAVPILAAAVGVLVVLPFRDRVRRLANHAVHGEDNDPATALARLGDRLGSTADGDVTEQVLPEVVARLAVLMRSRYVALDLADGTSVSHGERPADTDRVPLTRHGTDVGALVLGHRPRSRAERDRLELLATQAAVAVHSVLLARDLRLARQVAANAREEERRRVRRDMHDGLGPVLAALVLQAETARDLLPADPAAACALLDRMLPRLSGTVADVRALVQDLRPATLDELGLEGAVRELAVRFGCPGVAVDVEVEPLGCLPPAVDVAAYRIVAEAVTNAVRHADARSLRIVLWRDAGSLRLEVDDDGCGIALDAVGSGVGLVSMRQRALELDGGCEVAPAPTGRGTLVRARLPLGVP